MKVIVLFVFVLGALSAAGEDLIAKVGEKVTLKCGVSSYTRSLQWHHGADLLFTVYHIGFTRKGAADLAQRSVVRQTNLEISSVRETDAGRFTCLADGTRHEHSLSVFSVLVSVKPSAVLKLNDEATLQCEVKGQHHGCEVKWQSPNTDSPTNPSTVQLKPVTSSHNGAWQCIVTCGSNKFSQSLTITVEEPPTTTTPPTTRTANDCPLGLSCWMWIAIGVCCQFGIFLIVCVIVLCKCMRRRRACEERRLSNIYV
ncbi:roundabout homolog 1-like isoform X3 [Simochromis diagramma]|uniref:roundabout homolog 1-like isoform X3 n=1 Tax=Simochromis diagramma TaxID=43689 RepID=UPI001A7E35A8|nr:roundabout homolog 1-like isoform X3 [Simochromis diagramma]